MLAKRFTSEIGGIEDGLPVEKDFETDRWYIPIGRGEEASRVYFKYNTLLRPDENNLVHEFHLKLENDIDFEYIYVVDKLHNREQSSPNFVVLIEGTILSQISPLEKSGDKDEEYSLIEFSENTYVKIQQRQRIFVISCKNKELILTNKSKKRRR